MIVIYDDARSDSTTTVRDDGTAVTVGATRTGAAHFEVSRVAPDSDKPVVTGSTAWPETEQSDDAIGLCARADTYWALARSRHVMVSTDAGVTWKEAGDLGAQISFPRLFCTDNQLVIWSSPDHTHRDLRLCTRDACGKPIAVAVTELSMVSVRMEPKPELWIGEAMADNPYLVKVRRIETTGLVHDRDLLVQTSKKARETTLPAIHDTNGFAIMHQALGVTGY